MSPKTRNSLLLKLDMRILLPVLLILHGIIPAYPNATDSLKILVEQCNTDTCRFSILRNYYWAFADTDFERAKPMGEWAYGLIKNSKNIVALTDGIDIKGCILEKENKYDSAYVLFQKALALSKKINYNQRTGWSYYHIAYLNEKMGNIDSALYYYKTLADFDIKAGFSVDACNVLNITGSLYDQINQPDSALFCFNKALKLSRQIKSIDQEINTHFNLVWFYNKINNIKKELEHLDQIIELAENSNNEKAILNVYYYIGNLFLEQKNNLDVALDYYLRILDKSHSKFEYLEVGILNDIGKLYIAKGNDSMALDYTTKGLVISRKLKYKHQISEAYKNMGTIYMHQGEIQKAIDSYTYCYDLGCDKCPKIKFHSALIQIGDGYLKLGQKEKAIHYYREALKLANEFDSKTDQAISTLKIGNFYKPANTLLSEKYYLEAYQFAQLSNNIHVLKDVADTLNSFYRNKQNFRAAYAYQSIARTMEDSIANIEHQESMADWEMKFEFDKLNNENEAKAQLAALEIKRQKVFRNSAVLISLLLVLFGFVVFTSYSRKRKDNLLLLQQKKQIEEKNEEILTQVEEITAQKDEIERISNELHQADEMKLRFFSNISHEFRTPLTLILNPAKNLLENMPLNGMFKKQAEYIYTNAQKLYDLTNQIMDLQKLDAGQLKLNCEKDDIMEYCIGLISSFESLCEAKEIVIHIETNHKSVTTVFDRDKTGKIITNILSNALKFCFKKTVIDVQLHISDNHFKLTVRDKGIGIPANLIDNVFKRYFQTSVGSSATGTGIGLAYVKELVTFLRGNVTIESIEKEGTTVKVAIPLEMVRINDESNFRIQIPGTPKKPGIADFDLDQYSGDQNKKELILIVEDNNELREFISGLFRDNYRVILSKDGQEGIRAALKRIPDIIITDVMMPVKNGYELCAELKTDEHTSHIPIVMLTAKDNAQSSLEGYQTGADDYMLKPFDSQLLTLKVRNILNTRTAISRQFNADLNALPNAGSYSTIDQNFMKKCILIVEENIADPNFSVDILASKLAFSRSNLYRKIVMLTTLNPAELIRNIRMQHAARLLKTTALRVNEVAMEVGYDSAAKFSQAFKKHHGVLPSEIV
jgi:signal transduction histidine kinase/CheY-like chemotaxis protein/AraC-like DNA-binding protein